VFPCFAVPLDENLPFFLLVFHLNFVLGAHIAHSGQLVLQMHFADSGLSILPGR
jgi:hypothetical protein